MSAKKLALFGLCALLLVEAPPSPPTENPPPARARQVSTAAKGSPPADTATASAQLARLPLRFEANAGQWDPRVRFVVHGNGATLFVTDDAMTATLRAVRTPPRRSGASREEQQKARAQALGEAKSAAVTMRLVGVRPSAPVGENALVTRSNFFLGDDPAKWRTDVPNYGRVRARQWLPGVDVVWHGGPDGLEYDLVVAAGQDARKLAFEIDGADAMRVAEDGTLEISTAAGTLQERPPRVVQGGTELLARYRLEGAHRVGFDIEGYDRDRAVLVDPTLLYSTYLGGGNNDNDGNNGIAVDSSGDVYVTGSTSSTNFPTLNAYQTAGDIFIAKLGASGSSLVYSTYLGGSSGDNSYGITVDSGGYAYVVGTTASTNFPTKNAFQASFAGGGYDAFVAVLGPAGSALYYSTYLGGTGPDYGYGIAIDSYGDAYVTGYTGSTDFPTKNAFQGALAGSNDAFVTRIYSSGSGLLFSSYLGGSSGDGGEAVAVDANGNAYVTGYTVSTNFPTKGPFQSSNAGGTSDAFVTMVNASGLTLGYSTYLGGGGLDHGYGIAVDSSANAYVVGDTQSANFPTAAAYQSSNRGGADVFVTELTAAGSALAYSTYLGGSGDDYGMSVAVDSSGEAFVTGQTSSPNFPTVLAYQASYAGSTDAFLSKLSSAGASLAYSTYLGGSGADYGWGVAVDSNRGAYLAGTTASTNFPTVNPYQAANAGGNDAFIAKIGDPPLVLGPASASVPPRGSQTFTASGGSGGGYTYSLQTNASGGTINAATGAYTAGSTGNVVDIVLVTDSDHNQATANVNVGPGLTISPASPSTAPKGTINFTASGGSGTGYSWTITTDASGGSINASSGVYNAGPSGNVTDTVTATDSLGNTASVNVSVGAGISINPASPSAPPKGSISFSASGGSGVGYSWSVSANNSGASINASSGVYIAGATGNVTDTVTVSDSLGNTASTAVTVGPGVNVSPASASVAPAGTVGFAASGGAGGYVWSISTNNSGGTINTSTGAYKAGAIGSVTDVVTCEDSLGNVATASVTVTAALALVPAAASSPPKGSVSFAASGGAGGYVFSLQTNSSGAVINATTGAYTAGSTPNVTDVVEVTDANSVSITATVNVGAGVSLAPASPSTPPMGAITFSASGGSGTGYGWSFTANNSGGTINASTGAYTAGPIANVTDTVAVADSLGNTASVNVSVGAGVAINPANPSTTPQGSIGFSAIGGSGTGYAWAIAINNSGGSINASTGAYVAGTTGNVSDSIRVTDSLGNTAATTVTVGAAVSITPASPSTAPLGAIAFSASGGAGTGYTWALATNNSGASISASSGAYKAGSTGGVVDTVRVADSLGNTATTNVSVTAALSISPTSASVAPKGSASFTASGGAGSYVFTLQTNASGGNISSTGGAYTAGSTGSVTDVVRVTDGNNASVTANVTIGPGVGISPSNPATAPHGNIAFSASGGSGTGFAWALATNNSGGSINATTGAYTAGGTGNVADLVDVTDSLGNTASVSVSVGGGLAINPATPATPPKGSVAFSVTGGSGTAFVWSLSTNASGGNISASTGAYTAGATGNVSDVVKVVDSLSNDATVSVKVGPGVTVAPPSVTVATAGSVAFSVSGGSGTGYTWSLSTNASGGSIDASSGAYTAGATGNVTDIVGVTDSLGNTDTATVAVTASGSGDAGVDHASPGSDAANDADAGATGSGSSGCGCSTVDNPKSRAPLAALGVLALLGLCRRRRTNESRRA